MKVIQEYKKPLKYGSAWVFRRTERDRSDFPPPPHTPPPPVQSWMWAHSGTRGARTLGATLHRGRGGGGGVQQAGGYNIAPGARGFDCPGTGVVVNNFGSRFWQVAFRRNVGLYFMRGASTPNHHGTAVRAHIPGHHASGIRQPAHGGEVHQHHCGKTLLSRPEGVRGLPLLLGLRFYWWNWGLGGGGGVGYYPYGRPEVGECTVASGG